MCCVYLEQLWIEHGSWHTIVYPVMKSQGMHRGKCCRGRVCHGAEAMTSIRSACDDAGKFVVGIGVHQDAALGVR